MVFLLVISMSCNKTAELMKIPYAIWVWTRGAEGFEEPINCGDHTPHRKRHCWGSYLGMLRLAPVDILHIILKKAEAMWPLAVSLL